MDYDFEDYREFVWKVLGLVAGQILFTAAVCVPFLLVDKVKSFAMDSANMWILWLCLGLALLLILFVGCIEHVRRTCPLFLLMIFTILESILFGFYMAPRYPMHMLVALGLTFILCIILMLFALETTCDFTGLTPFLLVASIVLISAAIGSMFFHNRIYVMVLSSLMVLVFSFWLIVDIQVMLGGYHKYSFEPEDYIMAAISIYLDIISIFLNILDMITAIFG